MHRPALMGEQDDDLKHNLKAALRGLDYPATRSKLIAVALDNGASHAVLDRFRQLPETADFINAEALEDAFGVRVPGTHPHGWE